MNGVWSAGCMGYGLQGEWGMVCRVNGLGSAR